MKFFSIIIPVYKVEKYLSQCVDSVLNQTISDYEIILVDDGSPDKCPELCDKFAEGNDSIIVIHKANGGLSSARNKGIEQATGKYIIFLDSDDYWDDINFLKIALEKLNDTEIDVLLFGKKKYYQSINVFTNVRIPISVEQRSASLSELMRTNSFVACAWDKIVKRDLIEKNNLRFTENQYSEDIEWCIKLLLCDPIIDTIPIAPYIYRQGNTTSITANIKRKNLEDIAEVIEKYSKINMAEPVYHFLALELFLWMVPASKFRKNEISDLIRRLGMHWNLLNYSWYPYVKKVRFIKWIGIKNTISIVRFAYKTKNIINRCKR